MVDEPKGNAQGESAEKKEASSAHFVDGTPNDIPAPASQAQAENARNSIRYGEYVLRPFIAFGRFIVKLFKFLNEYDGAVTAIATLVIAGFTYTYVRYSREQWKVMDGQLKEMKAARQPWVGNDGGIQFPEQLQFELFPTTRNIHLYVRYAIKNYGTAPALHASSEALLFVQKGILVPPEGTMKLACMNADSLSDAVVFPGQSIQIDSDSRTNFDPTMHTIGQIWIVICTSYRDDGGKIHHTKTWALTKPPEGAKPVVAVPGDPLLYYPFSQAQIFHEETDEQSEKH